MTFDIALHEVCVRVGVRYVITKFSPMDSLPNFLTHGAPLRARESSATNLETSQAKIKDFLGQLKSDKKQMKQTQQKY